MLSLADYHNAFKSYDIRWIWWQEIDADFGYYLGRGLGEYIMDQVGPKAKILIAADTRSTNTPLINSTLLWLSQAGVLKFVNAWKEFDNYPHGVCSTSMAYQLWYNSYEYIIVFSASHNPANYSGMKIVTKDIRFLTTTLLKELFTRAFYSHSENWFTPLTTQEASTFYQKDTTLTTNLSKRTKMLDSYFWKLTKPHTFTIDYGHWAAVAYELDYINSLWINNWKLIIDNLFTTPDGSFPAHETDTSRFANYEKLLTEIQSNGSDFGFMFDGDADRLWIILPNWAIITGDILTAIVAKQMLTNGMVEQFWSNKVFYEVFSSQVVPQTIAQYGGTSEMVQVGRWAFADQVIEERWLLAWEWSAHILFGPYGTAEIPLLALALILKESEEFDSFEAMAKHYMATHKSQVYHFSIEDKDWLIDFIDNSYPDLEKNHVDWVRMSGEDYRFTIRKSGTEPIIKVTWEAPTEAIFNQHRSKLKSLIEEFGGVEE